MKRTNLLFKTTSLTKLLALMILTVSAIGLSSAVISIYVSKPIGDDFGAIVFYRPHVWLSNTWDSLMETGRYGQSIFGAIAYGSLGNKISVILPLIIIAWLATLIYLYTKSFLTKTLKINKNNAILSTIFTTIIIFLILFVNKGNANISQPTWLTYQIFFWPSGIVTYTTPFLILLTAIYSLFISNNTLTIRRKYIIFAIVIFLTGLFNEIQPVTVAAISFGLLALSLIKPIKTIFNYRTAYGVIIGSSSLALAALLLSSGSQKRQAATGVHGRGNIIDSVIHNFTFCINHLMFRPSDIFFFIATSALIAFLIIGYKKQNQIDITKNDLHGIIIGTVGLVAMLGSLLCSLTLLAIGYGVDTGIYTRTLLIPQIIYVLSFIILFTSIFIIIIKKTKPFVITIILMITILIFATLTPRYMNKIISQLNSSIDYSNAWNEQEILIKDQIVKDKNSTFYLPQSVSGIGVDENLSCVGATWLNYQIADYYGLKKVCSTLDPH